MFFVGHGRADSVFLLGHSVIWGAMEAESTWLELEDALRSQWQHPGGGVLRVDAAVIDAGDGGHMRMLVCGGREFADVNALESFLDLFHAGPRGPITLVIHGRARGADTMAGEWAQKHSIACIAFAANWTSEGRAAGPIRNKRMLDEGSPNLVVAFPGGRGTANMIRQARDRSLEVLEIG